MQDDVTKFPLNAKVRLCGDQNQVTVVLLIFPFVEFPTDMFDMYYCIFLLNSREIFTTKSRFDVTRKSVTSSRIRAIDD